MHCVILKTVNNIVNNQYVSNFHAESERPHRDQERGETKTKNNTVDFKSRDQDHFVGLDTTCRSVYVTLGYRWLLSMNILDLLILYRVLRPRRICDIYDFFAPHINVRTDLLTLLTSLLLCTRMMRRIHGLERFPADIFGSGVCKN